MRDFGLEVFFSEWEFAAKHHMTASDMESMSISSLLSMATDEQRQSFDNQWLGYTETWGAPALREEIAKTYETLKSENILCHAGANEAIYIVSRVLLQPGDHAIVMVPNYQSAETVPLSICEVSGVPLDADANRSNRGGWRFDLQKLKDAVRPNTKLVSLNFPNNPTGFVMSKQDQLELVEFCRERGIYFFSDEVYRGVELNPDDTLPQIADVYEKGISLNVISKAYGLPGLRVGWIASQDKQLLLKVERYKHFLSICNSAPSEALSIIALQNRKQIFDRNKHLLRGNLEDFEQLLADFPGLIDWQRPLGGCVAFPRYIGRGSAEDFCKSLLEESGILFLPASIYVSEVANVSKDRFRIGLGRDKVVKDGINAMRTHLEKHYDSLKA